MRFGVSGKNQRNLARSVAVLVIGGVAAGCSSDVTRFQDSILTGSSRLQQPAPASQPYPGDVAQVDQTYTGSVNRSALRPMNVMNRTGIVPRPEGNVQNAGMMPAANTQMASAQNSFPAAPMQPPAQAPAVSRAVTSGPALAPIARSQVDSTVTGTTATAPRLAPAVQPMPAAQPVQVAAKPASTPAAQSAIVSADGDGGWTRAGGTQVSVRQGETVYNLSRRFGVPVNAILTANGLQDSNALAAGQQVIIPTYVHSANAPVSAPDNNPNVADARSSTGTKYDVPSGRVPVPGSAPVDRVAVLPQQPKLKEGEPGQGTAATNTASNAPSAGAAGSYTVVAGDTLNGISRKTGVSTEALKQANGLSSGLIRIGQKLNVPAAGSAPVQLASAPAKIDPVATAGTKSAPAEQVAAYTPPQKADNAIRQATEESSASAPDASGIGRMRWPVRGRVIAPFGGTSGGSGDGIDIAVPEGTPIKAAENGVVIYAGDGLKEFGNTVLVRHEDGLVTVYGHASQIDVQRGQKVRRGEEIARAGMSGSANSPKLHFEVRKDSAPVDPVAYLE